jgi:ribosomal protein S18 acetylase RimI-like enzyme
MLRQATPEDAPVIALLGWVAFAETFGPLFVGNNLEYYLRMTYGVEKIRQSISKPYNRFWIAYWNGIPGGFIKIKSNVSPPADHLEATAPWQLQKIYVQQQFLTKKLGQVLFNQGVDYATKNGATLLWLLVQEDNARAIRFYEKNGWSKERYLPFTIGIQTFHFHLMAIQLK